jgi:hypothetical protein
MVAMPAQCLNLVRLLTSAEREKDPAGMQDPTHSEEVLVQTAGFKPEGIDCSELLPKAPTH